MATANAWTRWRSASDPLRAFVVAVLWLRRVLLGLQVGLTVVLLIAAGLLIKSYSAMRTSDLGCATRDVLTMRLTQPNGVKTPQQIAAFYDVLLERVRQIPGVTAAATVTGARRKPGRHKLSAATIFATAV